MTDEKNNSIKFQNGSKINIPVDDELGMRGISTKMLEAYNCPGLNNIKDENHLLKVAKENEINNLIEHIIKDVPDILFEIRTLKGKKSILIDQSKVDSNFVEYVGSLVTSRIAFKYVAD